MIDMEQEFLNIGLDIIGLGVFNFDFGSISTESPVIKVSLRCEHLPCSGAWAIGLLVLVQCWAECAP